MLIFNRNQNRRELFLPSYTPRRSRFRTREKFSLDARAGLLANEASTRIRLVSSISNCAEFQRRALVFFDPPRELDEKPIRADTRGAPRERRAGIAVNKLRNRRNDYYAPPAEATIARIPRPHRPLDCSQTKERNGRQGAGVSPAAHTCRRE